MHRLRYLTYLALGLAACGGETGGASADETETSSSADTTTTTESGGTDTSEGETGELTRFELVITENPWSTINPFADLVIEGASPSVDQLTVEVYEGETLIGSRRVRELQAEMRAFLWGLHANTEYRAIAYYDDGSGEPVASEDAVFTTGELPPDIPAVEVLVHDETRAHTGLVILPVKMDGRQAYLGIDPGGEVGWYYLSEYAINKPGGDLKVTLDEKFQIFRPGGIQIIEPWGEVLWDQAFSFHHDVTPMPNGDQLALVNRSDTWNVPMFGGDVEVEYDGILQIDPDGEIVKEWWTKDHIDNLSWPSGLGLQAEPLDWSHGNAIVWLEDSRQIMLSLRHQLGVFMIDWDTDELLWKLGPGGDFTLVGGDENDWFYNQHSPELQPDGTWLIYDNGTERPNGGQYSRAIRMELDEQAMTAEVVWEHVIPNGTPVQGDADRLHNGNILSCAGGVLNTGNLPRLVEATNDAASEVVWEVTVDGEGASNLYRATEIHDMDAL
jgi:hypothetical protein